MPGVSQVGWEAGNVTNAHPQIAQWQKPLNAIIHGHLMCSR